ncbi:MAG: filamentous hemagglutinin family protein, partial [Chthoniobacter sp.]|uniref:filamentous hemagglutinin family protein n=1 Tax=Chthoniobacter sp. TaxID=2510640 RepID=UPI0032ABBC70
AGTPSATYNAMVTRIFGADPQSLYSKTVIVPGAEVVNTSGNLTLGTATSTAAAGDWNMAPLRFGPKSVAGDLTLRAAGNLVFLNTLSDGFTDGTYKSVLLNQNILAAANAQSWSYRLVAGADFGAADFHQVVPLASLATDSGSLQLGRDNGLNISNSNGSNNTPGPNATTTLAVQGTNGNTNRYQVVRTGSGNIDIATGRDVDLLNEFATIYTAGTKVVDPTLGGTFDTPIVALPAGNQGGLGVIQQGTTGYAAQYTLAGGNVTINAQANIIHLTQSAGVLVDDSSKELPNNWLDRRGFVDPVTGLFGKITRSSGGNDIGSTTWWVDFSNFFEGVGALGGGNVTMIAGNDVSNVDGLVPTNARMPGKDALNQPIAPNAASLIELGGGDLTVRAGHNINGGVYYVERGNGVLSAGNQILTNSTRSPSLTTITGDPPLDSHTWLPTTLFAGKSSFQVSAAGNVLLGPVANVFLLPEGYNNTYWDKTYFSTLASNAAVTVSSLGGSVTLRESVSTTTNGVAPTLEAWLQNVSILDQSGNNLSYYQPWLRLDEDNADPFFTTASIQTGTFKVTAFSGDINVVGPLNLSPSPTGTIELAAAGAVNGLQPNGTSSLGAINWVSSIIDLSDASPTAIPGITTPFAYRSTLSNPNTPAGNRTTDNTSGFLTFVDKLFAETGSTTGAAAGLSTKVALHAPGPLHEGDFQPVRIYANGDISGLTLFSGKEAQVVAGNDITDIALYIQNVNTTDTSIVSAGRDIIAFNANSTLRSLAFTAGNSGDAPRAGDIQISGPGTLEVLAGRTVDLGTGAENADGTGSGITSIGNARNPALPFEGANVIVGAGVGTSALGLANSNLDVDTFLRQYLGSGSGTTVGGVDYFSELQDLLGPDAKLTRSTLDTLPEEQKAALALQLFYLILRDSGRAHNDPTSPTFGTYADGFAAIAKLFGTTSGTGTINTRARDIRTRSGGYINIFSPTGGLQLATATIGNPEIPPGIVTEAGGAISIFTKDNVDIGISRIFTLRGGDIIVWSSAGNIAAGSSAKTVQSAPPTRVVIDPQTANVATDLAGLATGGGIGVLATVEGVKPGNVDLIAPSGVVDAGDAGIRATGNLNIAATAILNAGNIQVAGTSSGVPSAPTVAAPNIGALSSANNAAAAQNTATDAVNKRNEPPPIEEPPSDITVEVLGYGGGEGGTSSDTPASQ